MKRLFPRTPDSLEGIFRFVEEFSGANGLGEDASFKTRLILEELFINMVRHRPDGRHDAVIELSRRGEELFIQVIDQDVEPFDLTQYPEPDILQLAREGRAGGLGIHLVRQLSDRITYEYTNRNSIITILNRWES